MKRNLRFLVVLLAAAMHLVAPVLARAAGMPAVASGDFCSAVRTAGVAPAPTRAPLPASEHHCAHAPCCAGGTLDSVAPAPRDQVALLAAHQQLRALAPSPFAASATAIPAAQPRGPPAIS